MRAVEAGLDAHDSSVPRMVTQSPSPVEGYEGLSVRTQARVVAWQVRDRLMSRVGLWMLLVCAVGAAYIAWLARQLGWLSMIVLGAVLVVAVFVGTVGAVCVTHWMMLERLRRRGWLVGYFSPTATQLVHPDQSGSWVLSDHVAKRRRGGLGAALREEVFPHLAREADRHGAVIVTETHVEKMVPRYMAGMPGLVVVGFRRTINGPTWYLRRDLQPPPSD